MSKLINDHLLIPHNHLVRAIARNEVSPSDAERILESRQNEIGAIAQLAAIHDAFETHDSRYLPTKSDVADSIGVSRQGLDIRMDSIERKLGLDEKILLDVSVEEVIELSPTIEKTNEEIRRLLHGET